MVVRSGIEPAAAALLSLCRFAGEEEAGIHEDRLGGALAPVAPAVVAVSPEDHLLFGTAPQGGGLVAMIMPLQLFNG